MGRSLTKRRWSRGLNWADCSRNMAMRGSRGAKRGCGSLSMEKMSWTVTAEMRNHHDAFIVFFLLSLLSILLSLLRSG